MTIKEVIDAVDNLKPNQYTLRDKVQWLSFVDEVIINDVLKTHEGYDGRYDAFTGYTEEDLSVALIVQSPYDRLYSAFLVMKIDQENGEVTRYNNSASMFNSYMMEFRKYYNKTHMPLSLEERKNIKPVCKPIEHITEAQVEAIKRDLYYMLSDDLNEATSDDKIYDIVMKYVNNNVQMLKGKDGTVEFENLTEEQKKQLSPRISEDGYWVIGNEKTGVYAKGEGITPEQKAQLEKNTADIELAKEYIANNLVSIQNHDFAIEELKEEVNEIPKNYVKNDGLTNYVKNTDFAEIGKAGIVNLGTADYGLYFKYNVPGYDGIPQLSVSGATKKAVNLSSAYQPITPKILDFAVKVGLVRASQSAEEDITLTDEEKSDVANWLGGGLTRIQTGSYEGVATDNSTKVLISFNFVPKIVIVECIINNGTLFDTDTASDYFYSTHLFNGAEVGYAIGGSYKGSGQASSSFIASANDVVWDNTNKCVEFTSSNYHYTNKSGVTYNWIAIG